MNREKYLERAANLFRKSMFVCNGFKKIDKPDQVGSLELPVHNDEVRALYFNEVGSREDLIVFSVDEIWCLNKCGDRSIPYFAVAEVKGAASKSEMDTSEIEICLKDGTTERIPIRGGQNGFRDFFAMQTGLMNLVRLNSEYQANCS